MGQYDDFDPDDLGEVELREALAEKRQELANARVAWERKPETPPAKPPSPPAPERSPERSSEVGWKAFEESLEKGLPFEQAQANYVKAKRLHAMGVEVT